MAKQLLKSVFMFEELSEQELKFVAAIAEPKAFRSGDCIFCQADESKAMYFIEYGSVRIWRETPNGENVDLTILASGAHFGEMGYLDGAKRSATAQALEQTDIVQIEFQKLNLLFEEQPLIGARFHRSVARYLAGRLRSTNDNLVFSREKNLARNK